ncbi:hypothetical protein JX265_010836 [Neoarthrinium moseri]|uniref:Ankyrin repeat protein n=1 Tax=Neoarthrinium moseri TaxID=1658444 RepID=A0A9Q0AJZ3_9PEZI|nr:uncharacterized protein JN550_010598 [Neoarthrinium moseri]KAI1841854.1 hypothetical protein JX266_011932 [Neoarthrinium moseri]KAI1858168.1 hypothetical protein JX265_010836 [Neoarthrinium moseri]KAI1861967.1 hypothetical protein JN550_010598 [Neoarthrinium moseri]
MSTSDNTSPQLLSGLTSAVESGDIDQVRSTLQAWDNDVSASERELRPAFRKALEGGDLSLIDEFLHRKVDTSGYETYAAMCKGSKVAKVGDIKLFELLESHGWDVNYDYGHFGDVLCFAVIQKNESLVKHLLDKGADPTRNTKASKTPLEWAAKYSTPEILSLVAAEATKERINSSRSLQLAAADGAVDKIDILLNAGADIDSIPDDLRIDHPDEECMTALHAAVANNQAACTSHLLAKGARKDIKNQAGLTPMEVASSSGAGECTRLLDD